MTDASVETYIIEKFKELDGLEKNNIGTEEAPNYEYPTVAFPNVAFTKPEDGYWYELHFIPAIPIQIELGTQARSRWMGILQVNVCVPKNSGTTPLNDRYENIAKLFRSGLIFNGIRIIRTYRTSALDDGDYYVMPVSIEWQADLDR